MGGDIAIRPTKITTKWRRDEADLPDESAAVYRPELKKIERHEIRVRWIVDAVD